MSEYFGILFSYLNQFKFEFIRNEYFYSLIHSFKIKVMSNFKQLINSEQPVLVDFFAEWCGPCKMMKPVLEEVAKKVEGKARILKVDIDKNQKAAAQYKIQGVPTLILFQGGKIKWRQSGYMDARQLSSVLEKHIQ